jgi:hypothetical protein
MASGDLLTGIEQRLGRDILPAERELVAAWREALAYIEGLCKNPKVDEDEVLALTMKEVRLYATYEVQCRRLEEDPDETMAKVHVLIGAELKRVFVDAAMQGFEDDISPEFLERMDKTYG